MRPSEDGASGNGKIPLFLFMFRDMRANEALYSLRLAVSEDAEVIARHRVGMFLDMGSVTQEESERLFAVSVPWLRRMLAVGEYVGWLALLEDEVVAGGGIHVRVMGPRPGCCRTGHWGHIINIYTVKAHRRRGLARLLMHRILEWGAERQLDQITLTASEDGRPLYEALGFIPTKDMKFADQV